MDVTPLTSAAEVLVATGHDVFARVSLRRPVTQGWHAGGATIWWGVDQHDHSSHVSALGPPAAVGRLLGELLHELPPRQRVTLPRGTGAQLPAWVGFDGTDWDFRWTGTAPRQQPGEERVRDLDDLDAIERLLRESSPTAGALPGDGDVHRWVGVPGDNGLLACAADTSTSPSVGHLTSIAVHPQARGQGLGRAVTARLSRELFGQGCDVVTLGMYATNTAGRALYDALGFRDDHRVTSGPLEVRSRW